MAGYRAAIRRVLVLILMFGGCSQPASEERASLPVRVVTVERAAGEDGLRYSASIEPQAQVPLSFKAQARVEALLLFEEENGLLREIQPGDDVEAGTILGLLDSSEYQEKVTAARAQLVGAEAALEAAQASFRRSSNLFASNSVTAPEYDRARKGYESASAQVSGSRAQLEQAELALRDCTLRSPWAGVVVKKSVEVGQLVSPATEAFEVADISSVKAVFGVPGIVLQTISLGTPISLQADAFPGMNFEGRVTAVSPAADQRSRVFQVQVTIPNPGSRLKIGMVGSLLLPGRVERFPVVPLNSVVRDPRDSDAYAVYVVDEERSAVISEVRRVEIGAVRGDWISIVSGVAPGERVVTNGATRVVSGQPVRIIP
ncbi:MAG: efflux RND transporter periplasmic adaptor subunit [Myxococcota bacterium]